MTELLYTSNVYIFLAKLVLWSLISYLLFKNGISRFCFGKRYEEQKLMTLKPVSCYYSFIRGPDTSDNSPTSP